MRFLRRAAPVCFSRKAVGGQETGELPLEVGQRGGAGRIISEGCEFIGIADLYVDDGISGSKLNRLGEPFPISLPRLMRDMIALMLPPAINPARRWPGGADQGPLVRS
jgi:hypothetical protein